MKQRILSLCLLFFSMMGFAQPIDWNKELPADPNVYVGKLPNGITYYLRHNEEPKNRASFYIIRNVGALLEEDNQDGLAHFLEHMAFNGTKNFPGNTLTSTLERHGISFGGNLNAYTTQEETVYNISDVPVTNENLIDTCLLILHDWSHYLTLDPKELDEERGVITEEWRTRNNSASRIRNQQMSVIYKGSKIAERDVIGELAVIQGFKPEEIRDFYYKWYRTDLEAIAIVGDFDIAKMEQKIKDLFSSIPAVENPAPRPFFEIPDHEETYFCLATDKEATGSKVQVMRIFRDKTRDGNGKMTYGDIKRDLMQTFYNQMINNRINEQIQRGEAPYMAASVGFYGVTRGYYGYVIAANAKPNQEKEAFIGAITEHEKVAQHGFTESELERVKTNFLTGLESWVKDKDKTGNEEHINDMQENFLKNEAYVDIEDYAKAAIEILPYITAEEISAQAKEWWKANNRNIIVSGPSEGVTHLTEEEARAILNEYENKPVAAYKDNTIQGSLITEELPGAEITKTKVLPEFEAEEWTLSNGAKVIYRKADYEKDEVSLTAYSPGGSTVYDDLDLLPAASMLGAFVPSYGIGNFDNISLRRLLTGKQAGCSVSVSGMYETINGGSTPKDFETMMQLLYLKFTAPRFDTLVHNVLIERTMIGVKQAAGQPQTIMKDSLQLIRNNYHPRTMLQNEDFVNKVTIDRIEKIYRDRISDASDFTFFIVGNVEKEEAQAMVKKYIGSIPSSYRKEHWVDHKVREPKGVTEKIIYIPLEIPKSTVIVNFVKEMKFNLKNSYMVNILGNILSTRYTKSIREEQGGTYGVGVRGAASREPYCRYSMFMQFDCDPDKAETLKPLLYKEIEDIKENGVTEDELSKIVKNMLKESEQGKAHNSYWMNTLSYYYKTGINQNDPKNFEEVISSLTTKDIQKFTKKMFKNVNVIDLIFAPAAK